MILYAHEHAHTHTNDDLLHILKKNSGAWKRTNEKKMIRDRVSQYTGADMDTRAKLKAAHQVSLESCMRILSMNQLIESMIGTLIKYSRTHP